MIEQMKKTAIIVQSSEKKNALKALRSLGVIHLDELEGSGEDLQKLKQTNARLEKALGIIAEKKLTKKQKLNQFKLNREETIGLADKAIALADKRKNLQDKIVNNNLEIQRISLWGNFDPSDVNALSEKGVYFKLYEIPAGKYKNIGDDVTTVLVNKAKGVARFIVVKEDAFAANERPAGLPSEAFEVVLPKASIESLQKEIKYSNLEIYQINEEIKQCVYYVDALNDCIKSVSKDIEFENIHSGMGNDVELSWLTGYIPAADVAKVQNAAKANNWALVFDDPTDEDPTPTKLKNNKFVSLIYPLTDFLEVTPGYNEFDISGWFLLFFTIFFGMIFGDAGYGSLVTGIVLLMMIKSVIKGEKVADAYKLVGLLGISTIIWGTVTCNWFGLEKQYLPEFLVNLRVQPLSDGNSTWIPFWGGENVLTSGQNLQIFCFTLALAQLSVAHLKCVISCIKKKNLKGIGDFGALLQLWGMFYFVLNMVVSGAVFSSELKLSEVFGHEDLFGALTIYKLAIYLIGGGFGLSFIFSNYEGSIIQSILASVKSIISVLLGVVNVFSDIVSYIRLWAVGLAGSAIAATVNGMASGVLKELNIPISGEVAGHFIIFAILLVVLLVFGHGLNMILNLLSVVVHGVRLNTMEFSQHLGMSWSGTKYAPFSENK